MIVEHSALRILQKSFQFFNYSRLPITRAKDFEIAGVRVIGISKQLTGNKQISKCRMGRECKYHAHFTSRAARDIDYCNILKTELSMQQSLINILR